MVVALPTYMARTVVLGLVVGSLLLTACQTDADAPASSNETVASMTDAQVPPPEARVPDWVADAVFYQIFPERFADSDLDNAPTRETLQRPYDTVPDTWAPTPWTGDWYAQSAWEAEMGDFYSSVTQRRYGGDLQGIIDRLDYLDTLGINALYLNPVFWGQSMHKYDNNTFHHIDPYFGPDPEGDIRKIASEDPTDPDTWTVTAADSLFFALLDEAHERDIRVVIDGVFNHTGRDFFAFRDLVEHRADSRFASWYDVNDWNDLPDDPLRAFDYDGWWGSPYLPEFAKSEDGTSLHPEVQQYIFDATARWMAPDGTSDAGVDGWRLDVAEEVPDGFWRAWHAHVRELNPQAYTVAEVWDAAPNYLERTGFSATMNYHAFAYPVKGFLVDAHLAPSSFADLIEARRSAFPEALQPAQLNLVDSHDTPRIATQVVNRADTGYVHPERFDYDEAEIVSPASNPEYKVRAPDATDRRLQTLVALFQMTYPGAPMIYYGTEAGMWGADDPDNRKPMVWPDRSYSDEATHPLDKQRTADPVAFNDDLFATYQALIALRHKHPALRRGTMDLLQADDERTMLAYSRTHDGESIVVVLNRSNEAHSARIPLPEPLRETYEVAWTSSETYRLQQDAEALLLEVDAHAGLVLHHTDASH